MNSLFIKSGEEILQIDKKVYKIPKNMDLRQTYNSNEKVNQRTIELSREYGTNFEGFSHGISCIECNHTEIFNQVVKENRLMIFNGRGPCNYKMIIDKINVFFKKNTSFFDRKKYFMAKDSPCTVKDAFYMALQEQGHLDEFLLFGKSPEEFPCIDNFEKDKELEEKALNEYHRLKKFN